MASIRENHILGAAKRALSPTLIRSLAAEHGVVRRQRKVDIVAFVSALVLGFPSATTRTLAGLRRSYTLSTGESLAPSSFHARFTPALVVLMKALAEHAIAALTCEAQRPRGIFDAFRGVLAADSSLVRLHDALAEHYPSVWTNHTKASAKLGMVINVLGRSPHSLSIHCGSRHDIHLLEPGPWLKNRLVVFDLGFFGAALFRRIHEQGGYFLSRMRKHGNPVLSRSLVPTADPIEGRTMNDVLRTTTASRVDVEATMVFQERLDVIKNRHATFRFIAIFHPPTATWHRYVTNMPVTMMAAEDVPAAYAARWEIELLFRELKQRYRVDQLPTQNRSITECLLYAAVLALVVSRRIHRVVTRSVATSQRRVPLDRWAALFQVLALPLLRALVAPRNGARLLRPFRAFLLAEAADPNRRRLPLDLRSTLGIVAFS